MLHDRRGKVTGNGNKKGKEKETRSQVTIPNKEIKGPSLCTKHVTDTMEVNSKDLYKRASTLFKQIHRFDIGVWDTSLEETRKKRKPDKNLGQQWLGTQNKRQSHKSQDKRKSNGACCQV